MSNHAIQTLTANLPPRVNQLLLLAIALLGTGATIAAFSHGVATPAAHPSVHVTAPTAVAAPMPKTDFAPTLLPAVIVTPAPEMTTLATITVRPARATRSAANPQRIDDFALGAIDDAHATASSPTGGGFAMPYYSFSRSQHRPSKE